MSSEGTPGFLRQFSKETNKEERDALAGQIRADRSAHFEKHEEHNETVAELEKTQRELDEYNSASFFSKAKDYFHMRATRERLGLLETKKAKADTELKQRDPVADTRSIEQLYAREQARWASSEYTKEDIIAQFSEEHLASLSMEDYVLLLRRFPSEMVTHVTRQGIRDHASMFEHSAGVGKMSRGFKSMLKEGSLKSPLAIDLVEAGKKDDLFSMLSWETLGGELPPPSNRLEALERMRALLGKFHDKSAVHFAAEQVADAYYGAERGNEIFVAYPSALIASAFHSGESSLTPTGTLDAKHNDVYVWGTGEKGIDLNAGLVFIPEDTEVSPKTGSRYETDDRSGEPIPEEEGEYKKAEHPIPSKEYWEQYFAAHPDERPSKIVYYKGGDPTRAFRMWREEQGLDRRAAERDIIPEHRMQDRQSEPAQRGSDRFEALLQATIDERFPTFTPREEYKMRIGAYPEETDWGTSGDVEEYKQKLAAQYGGRPDSYQVEYYPPSSWDRPPPPPPPTSSEKDLPPPLP